MSEDCNMKSFNDKQMHSEDIDFDEFDILDETEKQEYQAVNSALDQISSCLDVLEQQSDNLNNQLRDLLESTRQARKELFDAIEKESHVKSEKQ